jgi:nucleotide-binding universal stress UspA family protein
MRYCRILHPTDYTDESRPALLAAADLAHDHGAALILLHVVETLGPEQLSVGEVTSRRQPEAYRKKLWDEIHHLRPADPNIHVEYVLSEEDLVTAILRTAEERQCDLIVMATRGLSGWRRWLTGSAAEEVVRRSACHVLIVKAPHPHALLPSFEATELHPGQLSQEE